MQLFRFKLSPNFKTKKFVVKTIENCYFISQQKIVLRKEKRAVKKII